MQISILQNGNLQQQQQQQQIDKQPRRKKHFIIEFNRKKKNVQNYRLWILISIIKNKIFQKKKFCRKILNSIWKLEKKHYANQFLSLSPSLVGCKKRQTEFNRRKKDQLPD